MAAERPAIWTIGHSNHGWGTFLDLLRQHDVEILVDVRSVPNSRWAPWAARDRLRASLGDEGVRYVWRGDVLGGKPDEDRFFDDRGRVRRELLAGRPGFTEAVEGLVEAAGEGPRIVLMCAEEDPAACHRRLLVGRALRAAGAALHHIRGDGTVESEEALSRRESGQIELFGDGR